MQTFQFVLEDLDGESAKGKQFTTAECTLQLSARDGGLEIALTAERPAARDLTVRTELAADDSEEFHEYVGELLDA